MQRPSVFNNDPDTRLTPRPSRRRVSRLASGCLSACVTAFGMAGLAASMVASMAACGGEVDTGVLDQELVELGPLSVGEYFVSLNASYNELWTLRATDDGVERSVIPLSEPAGAIRATPDDRIALLSNGEPMLTIIDPAQPLVGQQFDLDSGYNAIQFSDDGAFAVLFFAPNTQGYGNDILINPNEMSIIDLREGTQEVFSLRGPRPNNVQFLDPVTFADPTRLRRFITVFAENTVSLVDLEAESETDRQRMVPLVSPESERTLVPREVLASRDDPADPNDLKLFVRASGTTDLYVIDVIPSVDGATRELQPSINQISTNSVPADLISFEAGSGASRREFLLVAGGSARSVTVIDVQTSATTEITLDRQVDASIVWEDVDEFGNVVPRALLYAVDSDLVYFARLDELARQGMGALRPQRLSNPVEHVELVEGGTRTRAVVRYQNGSGVGILNVDDRFEYPIEATLTLGQFAIVGDLLFTAVPGASALGVVHLENTATGQVELPGVAQWLVHGQANNTLLVTHDDPTGWFSLVNITDLEQTPHEIVGLYLDGIMDREY